MKCLNEKFKDHLWSELTTQIRYGVVNERVRNKIQSTLWKPIQIDTDIEMCIDRRMREVFK
jgi:hypothetical protein